MNTFISIKILFLHIFWCFNSLQCLLRNLGKEVPFDETKVTLLDAQKAYGDANPKDMLGENSAWSNSFPDEKGMN